MKFMLITVLLVSLTLRVFAWIIIPNPILSTNASIAYVGGAEKIVNGSGFLDPEFPIFTPPLYAVLISGFLEAFGSYTIPIKGIQIVLDTCTVFLVYRITLVLFTWKAAVLASSLWALYPFAIYSTLYVGTEAVFTFLLCLFTFITISAVNANRLTLYSVAGVVLGLATLTRGATQFIPLFFPLLWFFNRTDVKKWLLGCLILTLSFLFVILPWGLRNLIVLGDFVPVARAGGVFLWGSSEELWTIEERERELPRLFRKMEQRGIQSPSHGSTLEEKDKHLFRIAIANYKSMVMDDPFVFSLFMFKKFLRVWFATESGKNHGLVLAINLPFYCLAIIGVMSIWKIRIRTSLLPLFLVAYFVALHSLTFPLFRYTLPIMPYILMFGSLGVVYISDRNMLDFRRQIYPQLHTPVTIKKPH